MANNNQPNYNWWSKADNWSLKEASLLLHGLDPHAYRSLRLAEKDIPSELSDVQRTYFLLKATPWKERYAYHVGKGLCPMAVVTEAVEKELAFPQELHEFVSARFKRKNHTAVKNTVSPTSISPQDDEQRLAIRERRTFLKSIGILIQLLLDSNLAKKMCAHGQKPSAFQIMQLMLEKAEALGMEVEGLKSIDRKITKALALLAEESLEKR